MIVTKETPCSDFTEGIYEWTVHTYGPKAIATNIMHILKESLGKSEWDIATETDAMFDSYLIDKAADLAQGRSVDLDLIYQDLLKKFIFSGAEKRLLEKSRMEERLLGILLAVTRTKPINNNKQQ